MIVLGMDPPGGWAILEMRPGTQRPLFLACGVEECWEDIPTGLFRGPRQVGLDVHRVELVCVEDAVFFFPSDARKDTVSKVLASRGQALWDAGKMGQRVLGAMVGMGLPAVEITSPEWRRHLGVKVGGTKRGGPFGAAPTVDRLVADALRLRVEGWPARSNDSQRDAAGVAIGGHAKWRLEHARRAG